MTGQWPKTRKQSKAALHPDHTKSAVQKNIERSNKCLIWFRENADFDESDDKTNLISYSTGLISEKGKDEMMLTPTNVSRLELPFSKSLMA